MVTLYALGRVMKMNLDDTMFEQFHRMETVWRKVRAALPIDVFPTIVIGGGAVRDFYFGFEPKDYDVFLIPEKDHFRSLEMAYVKLQRAFENPHNLVKLVDVDEAIKGGMSNYTIKLMDSEVTQSGENNKAIQFLYKDGVETPQQLIETFDLDICQFGYDGNELYVGSEVDVGAVKKAMQGKGPVKLLSSGSTYARLLRFQTRYGCDVQQAANDLKDIVRKEGPSKFVGKPCNDDNWVYWRSKHSDVVDGDSPVPVVNSGGVDLEATKQLLKDCGMEFGDRLSPFSHEDKKGEKENTRLKRSIKALSRYLDNL